MAALQSNTLKQDILYRYLPGGTLPFDISGILLHEGELTTNATFNIAFQHLLDNDLFMENMLLERAAMTSEDPYFSVKVVPSVDVLSEATKAALTRNATALTLGISEDFQSAKFFSLVPRNECYGPVVDDGRRDAAEVASRRNWINNEFYGHVDQSEDGPMRILVDSEYLVVESGRLYGLSKNEEGLYEQTEISFPNFYGTEILLAKFAPTRLDTVLFVLGQRDDGIVMFYLSMSEYPPLYGESLREIEAVFLDGAPSGAEDLIGEVFNVFSSVDATVLSTDIGILEMSDFQNGMPRRDRIPDKNAIVDLPAPASVSQNALLCTPVFSENGLKYRLRESAEPGTSWDTPGAYSPIQIDCPADAEDLGNSGKYVWNVENSVYESGSIDPKMTTSLLPSSIVGVGEDVVMYTWDGNFVCEIPRHNFELEENEPWNAHDYTENNSAWLYGEMTKYKDLSVSSIVSRMDKSGLENALKGEINDVVRNALTGVVTSETATRPFEKTRPVSVGDLFEGARSNMYGIRRRFAELDADATVDVAGFYQIQDLTSAVSSFKTATEESAARAVIRDLTDNGKTSQAVPSILSRRDEFFGNLHAEIDWSNYGPAHDVLKGLLVDQAKAVVTQAGLEPSAGSGIAMAASSSESDEFGTDFNVKITLSVVRHVSEDVRTINLTDWPENRIYIDPETYFVYNNVVYRSVSDKILIIDPFEDSSSSAAVEDSSFAVISPELFDDWISDDENAEETAIAYSYDENGTRTPYDNIEDFSVEIPCAGGKVLFDVVYQQGYAADKQYGVKSIKLGTIGTPDFQEDEWITAGFDVEADLLDKLTGMRDSLYRKDLGLIYFEYDGNVDNIIQKPEWAEQASASAVCSIDMDGSPAGSPWTAFAGEFSRINECLGQITGAAESPVDIGPESFAAEQTMTAVLSFTPPASFDYSDAVDTALTGAVGFVIPKMEIVENRDVFGVSPMMELKYDPDETTFQRTALQALADELNSRPRLLSFEFGGEAFAPEKFYNIVSNGVSSFWGLAGQTFIKFDERFLYDVIALNCPGGTDGGDFVTASGAELSVVPYPVEKITPASSTASVPVAWVNDSSVDDSSEADALRPYMDCEGVSGLFKFYDRNTETNDISERKITNLVFLRARNTVWISVEGENDVYEFKVPKAGDGVYSLKKWECTALYKTAYSGAGDWSVSWLGLSDRDEETLRESENRTLAVVLTQEGGNSVVQYFAFSNLQKESSPGSRLALTNVFDNQNLRNAHDEVGPNKVDGMYFDDERVVVIVDGEMTEFLNEISQPMSGSTGAVQKTFETADPFYTTFYLDSSAVLTCLDVPEDMLGLYAYSRIYLTDYLPLLDDPDLAVEDVDMSQWHIGQAQSPIYVYTNKGMYTIDMGAEPNSLPYETDEGIKGFFKSKANSLMARHIERFHDPMSILERFNKYRQTRDFYRWYEVHPFAMNGYFGDVTYMTGEDGNTFADSGRDWTGSVRCWNDVFAEKTVVNAAGSRSETLFAAVSSPLLDYDSSWTKAQLSSPIRETAFYDRFAKVATTEGGEPYVKDSADLGEIPFIYKANSDLTWDLYATIPTTMTPYINRVEGTYDGDGILTNSSRSERKNLENAVLSSGVNESATKIRLYMDAEYFQCRSVQEVEVSGSSLPMYIYRDRTANDGHFDGIAAQSVCSSKLVRVDENGHEDENGRWAYIEFAVWGADEQSVHVRGRSAEIYDTEVPVYDSAEYHIYYSSVPIGTRPEDWQIENMPTMKISAKILAEDGLRVQMETDNSTLFLAIPSAFSRGIRWLAEDETTVVTPVRPYNVIVDDVQYACYVWDSNFYQAQTVVLKAKSSK